MYSDVERLQGILRDLGGLVNEPNSLPDVTRDYIEVGRRACGSAICSYNVHAHVVQEMCVTAERASCLVVINSPYVTKPRFPMLPSINVKHEYKFVAMRGGCECMYMAV